MTSKKEGLKINITGWLKPDLNFESGFPIFLFNEPDFSYQIILVFRKAALTFAVQKNKGKKRCLLFNS